MGVKKTRASPRVLGKRIRERSEAVCRALWLPERRKGRDCTVSTRDPGAPWVIPGKPPDNIILQVKEWGGGGGVE